MPATLTDIVEGFRPIAQSQGWDMAGGAEGMCIAAELTFRTWLVDNHPEVSYRCWYVDGEIEGWITNDYLYGGGQNHNIPLVSFDHGATWIVVDWTFRQFVPESPFPLVEPEATALARWRNKQEFNRRIALRRTAKGLWELTPDQYAARRWVFHGTSRSEDLETLLREGVQMANVPQNPARQRYQRGEYAEYAPGAGVGQGLYVSGSAYTASEYGRHVVAIEIHSDAELALPPESNARDLADAWKDHNGVLVVRDIPADRVFLVGRYLTRYITGDPYQTAVELSKTSGAARQHGFPLTAALSGRVREDRRVAMEKTAALPPEPFGMLVDDEGMAYLDGLPIYEYPTWDPWVGIADFHGSTHTAVATGKKGTIVWRGFNVNPGLRNDSTGTPFFRYRGDGMHPELVELGRKLKDGTLTFSELVRFLRTEGVGTFWAEHGPHASEGGRTGEEVARSYSGGVRGMYPGAHNDLEEPFSKYWDSLPGNGEMAIVLKAELLEDAEETDGEGMLELDDDHPLRLLEVSYNGGWGWHTVPADGRRVTAKKKISLKSFLKTAEFEAADPLAALGEVFETIDDGEHTHSGLIIKAVDSGRVLLTQRTPYAEDPDGVYGRWEFPGGGIGEGEDAFTSAVREFREETGLELPEDWVVAGHYENGPYLAIVVLVPHEAWTTNAQMLSHEVMGVGWFTVDQIEDTDLGREELGKTDWDLIKEAARPSFAPRPLVVASPHVHPRGEAGRRVGADLRGTGASGGLGRAEAPRGAADALGSRLRARVAAQYSVSVLPSARKAYQDLHPNARPAVLAAVKSLRQDAFPAGAKTLEGPYRGYCALHVVVGAGGHYRVLYKVDGGHITVIMVGTRENFYDKASGPKDTYEKLKRERDEAAARAEKQQRKQSKTASVDFYASDFYDLGGGRWIWVATQEDGFERSWRLSSYPRTFADPAAAETDMISHLGNPGWGFGDPQVAPAGLEDLLRIEQTEPAMGLDPTLVTRSLSPMASLRREALTGPYGWVTKDGELQEFVLDGYHNEYSWHELRGDVRWRYSQISHSLNLEIPAAALNPAQAKAIQKWIDETAFEVHEIYVDTDLGSLQWSMYDSSQSLDGFFRQLQAGGATVAMLHDEPEAALPSTDGSTEEVDDPMSPAAIAQRKAMLGDADDLDIAAAANAYLAKIAVKRFTPLEQMELIEEGEREGVTASNLDRLEIAGTHYEALEDRYRYLDQAQSAAEDLFL